jgi:hypothetical protein
MATWAIVALVLGSNIIIALATFLTTKYQVSHSETRFEKELNRQREIESRQRRWEVRDAPLLKLRDELAVMATKNHRMVTTASMLHTNILSGATDEQIKEWLDNSIKDWNKYVDSGAFEQVLFTVGDKEILDKVERVRLEYKRGYIKNIHWKSLPVEELTKILDLPKELKEDVREVQELINKRLEEL